MDKNPFSLEGKTILVTGASSGIGRGIAIACAQMGGRIILNGRSEERLKETLHMLNGNTHEIVVSDLSSQDDLERMSDLLPNLHGWVNSAGIPKVSPIKYFNRSDVEDILNVNTISTMMLLSLLLKKKKLQRGSSVVFISSISGVFVGTSGDTSYCASKGAVNGFTKGAAVELARQGIRVNSINPGLVPTNIFNLANEKIGDTQLIDNLKEKYPLKRLGLPADIGNGAVFLLSEASDWITGQNLVIDGGISIS